MQQKIKIWQQIFFNYLYEIRNLVKIIDVIINDSLEIFIKISIKQSLHFDLYTPPIQIVAIKFEIKRIGKTQQKLNNKTKMLNIQIINQYKNIQNALQIKNLIQIIETDMNNSNNNKAEPSGVSVLQRKKYGCFCNIFCCKCVYCCQSLDFSLLTSQHRRDAFFNMINQYIKSIQKQPNIIIDPFFILLGLLLGESDQQINTATLLQIGDGQQKQSIFSMEDLEMYIPQLCTYLVFHQQMQNIPIFNLLERTARFDIQFALLYYSYMRSLEIINQNTEFKVVMKYNRTFKKKIDQHFKYSHIQALTSSQINSNSSNNNNSHALTKQQEQIVYMYSNRGQSNKKNCVQFQKIKNYPDKKLYKISFDIEEKTGSHLEDQYGIFGSSLNFIGDLVWIGRNLIKVADRKSFLYQHLQKINTKLPADIYLPLKNQSTKGMKVANIIFQQCRVFSTKMRAPYYICLELFQDKIEVDHSKYKRIVSTMNINLSQSQLRKSHLFQQDTIQEELVSTTQFSNNGSNNGNNIEQCKGQPGSPKNNGWISKIYKLAKNAKKLYHGTEIKQQSQTTSDIKFQNETQQQQQTLYLFGQSQIEQQKRIKQISPFSQLPNYRLAHFIVKTQDDLRQQAFAMQLLQQFNRIFIMEGLKVRVVPYQVIPLGHNCGIIQCLKDSITVDQLRKKQGNLEFVRKDPKKLKKFLYTLVGYSLVSYLIQVKDRHNGNIMIRKDGSIIHIDFGFFMSNAPGKGVELQKKVAFKMTPQYIQTLGGLQSKQFAQFRKLFFLGYQACIKHQHRLLIPIKLMYSSHGTTMPCFLKGNLAIQDLQRRLNPPGMMTDGYLSLYCQNLINKSIDNWRARWYDKWQYYMQGILY